MTTQTKPLEIETRQRNLVWPVISDDSEGSIRTQYYQEAVYAGGLKSRRVDGFQAIPYLQKQGDLEKKCWGVCHFWNNFEDCVSCYAEEQKTKTYAGHYDPNFHPEYIITDISLEGLKARLISELEQKRAREIDAYRKEGALVGEVPLGGTQ